MAKKKVKELSDQELMKSYKQDVLKKLVKKLGSTAGRRRFSEMEEKGMFNKGGMAKKNKPMKASKGGTTMAMGKAKMAKKKMRGGGMMKRKMMGGGMAKMSKKKKMMRGGMAKKKR